MKMHRAHDDDIHRLKLLGHGQKLVAERNLCRRRDDLRAGCREVRTGLGVWARRYRLQKRQCTRAAREVGGLQIQNAGTVAGNICNASPAADGIPALLALEAEVELSALDGVRRVPLEGFVTGSRTTRRRPDELMTAILIPPWGRMARATFLKLGARRYMVISIVMVAATLETGIDGKVARAAVAVGACSEVACRLTKLEAKLLGKPVTSALGDLAQPDDLAPLAPISDIRGSAEYRRDAALTLVRRALSELGNE
jgi:CO/xanthine dehydrogenase FAD-binding subunit